MLFTKKSTQHVLNVRPVQAVSFIRPLIGKLGPAMVRADDGALYVVKTWGNRLHPNALANELLGSAVIAAVGLPVPPSRPIELSRDFLNSTGLSVSYKGYIHQPEPGIHHGSQFLAADPEKAFLIEYIDPNLVRSVENRRDFLGMYILDVCFKHRSSRQAVFIKSKNGPASRAVFIDNDQMFGGSNWDMGTATSNHGHQTVSLYHGLLIQKDVSSWLRKFGANLPLAVDSAIKGFPSEWYAGDLTSFHAWLHHRIETLPTLLDQELARDPLFRKYADATMLVPSSRIYQIGT